MTTYIHTCLIEHFPLGAFQRQLQNEFEHTIKYRKVPTKSTHQEYSEVLRCFEIHAF